MGAGNHADNCILAAHCKLAGGDIILAFKHPDHVYHPSCKIGRAHV